jgi:integrase
MGGVWYFDITTQSDMDDDDSKRLKSESSHRFVPLRQEVIDLGFIAYVHGLSKRERQLFPALKANAEGRRTQAYSKRFAYYLDKIEIKDRRKVFHSFRHTFKDICRGVIDKEIHDALTGHAANDVGSTYSGSIPVERLKGAMDKLDFSAFPLEELKKANI